MNRNFATGEYAPDGKARREAVRAAAGHRCIRCGHPFETGKHGKGEWSPCDEKCTHGAPIRIQLRPNEWVPSVSSFNAGELVEFGNIVQAQWRILTVHHFDGNKSNDAWWNLLSLCQRCHLQIQCRVNPQMPFFFEHSDWLKPYVAGFYAHKYEGKNLTREEVESRLEELLKYELRTA